jgi:hypothetical protein
MNAETAKKIGYNQEIINITNEDQVLLTSFGSLNKKEELVCLGIKGAVHVGCGTSNNPLNFGKVNIVNGEKYNVIFCTRCGLRIKFPSSVGTDKDSLIKYFKEIEKNECTTVVETI